MKEYTEQEIIEIINQLKSEGKFNLESFAELVLDPKFPQNMYESAYPKLIKLREYVKEYKELLNAFYANDEKMKVSQKENWDEVQKSNPDFERVIQLNNEGDELMKTSMEITKNIHRVFGLIFPILNRPL